MANSDTSLHSADSLSNEALSPALTAPMFSCPSASPLICSLDMKNKFFENNACLFSLRNNGLHVDTNTAKYG